MDNTKKVTDGVHINGEPFFDKAVNKIPLVFDNWLNKEGHDLKNGFGYNGSLEMDLEDTLGSLEDDSNYESKETRELADWLKVKSRADQDAWISVFRDIVTNGYDGYSVESN